MPTKKKDKQKKSPSKRIKSETKEEPEEDATTVKAEIKTDIKFDEKTGLANLETFERQYALIKEMRAEKNAPVDTMGCSKLYENEQSESEKRYQVLLSLMLSSQTKDEVTAKAMQNLAKHGATMQNIHENTTEEAIADLIYPVSFYKRKAKYIKDTTKMLIDKYDSDIPSTVEELMKLPGVGPKMAYLCMSHAWNNTVGIGVDVHVNRISNRIGWAKTKTPEQTRKQLEEYVPKELWSDVNEMLVGFGQTICKPVGPKCGSCKLMENNLCIYYAEHVATKPKKPAKKKLKKEVKEEQDDEDEPKAKQDSDVKVKLEENQSSSDLIADIESMFGEDFTPRRSPRKRKPVRSYAEVKDEKV